MKNSYETCMKLLRAESEAEVIKIIEDTPEMADEENWEYLGRNSQNNSLVSAQAANSIKALTELMTNMVDATLLKEAHKKGINPRGNEAPPNMHAAVDEFIHPATGRLSQLGSNDAWVKEYAPHHLVVAISGDETRKPCFTMVDRGE